MATPIHQQGLGPGGRAASQAGEEARRTGRYLDLVKAKGGAALKILNDFAGPLALASGAALTFATAMAKGLRNTELVQRGLQKIEKMQVYSPEFAKFLGGLDQAKRRLEEIWRSPAKKVFGFDDAAVGNKRLEILTGGLLSTKRGMKEIGDLAAAGGTGFTEMASLVGALYDDLANGRPIGATVQQLRQLGVISTDTANKIETLQANGAGFAATWSVVHEEIRKSSGSMKTLEKTISGLKAKLESSRDDQAKSVGEQFAEGEKAGLEAQIRATEAMTPVLKNVSVVLGSVWTWWQKMKAAAVEFAAAIPGVKGGLVGLITGFAALVAMLAAFSLVTTIQGIIALTAALYSWAAASAVATGATGVLARAVVTLGTAMRLMLGPWGLVIAAATAVAGLFADAAIEANTFGKAQEDLKRSIEETNKSLQSQIRQIQTQADKSTAIGAANKELIDAEERLTKAKQDQRQSADDINPLNDAAAAAAVKAREAERDAARQTLQQAQGAPTNAAIEAAMGPEYAEAKRQSEDRQRAMEAERQQLEQQRAAVVDLERARAGKGGVASVDAIERAQARVKALGAEGKSSAQIAEEQRALAQRQGQEGQAFSKDNLDKIFNAQQAVGETRVRAMRELSRRTGDLGLRDQADSAEDQLFKRRREKELIESGFTADRASRTAGAETELNAAIRARERAGTPQTASLAQIGGAGGFAGLLNDVPKQQLDVLKRIEQELETLNQTVKPDPAQSEDKWKQ